MPHQHIAVWLDHKEAKIFHVGAESFDLSTVRAPHHHVRRHPHATAEHEHPADAKHYYHEVAKALTAATEILVVGPSTAKLELVKHIHSHDASLVPKIVGVETVDHPTDGQLVKYMRSYFEAVDAKRA